MTDDYKVLSPEDELKAMRSGVAPGILVVAWCVAFSLLKDDLSPAVYWVIYVSVAVLIIAVPSWLAGQRAKRAYYARAAANADDGDTSGKD